MGTSAGAAEGPSSSLDDSPTKCHGLYLKIPRQLGVTYGIIVFVESCSNAQCVKMEGMNHVALVGWKA